MPSYDSVAFNPPAPTAQVIFLGPHSKDSATDVSMLIDTGADISVVPLWVVKALELDPSFGALYETTAFDGTVSRHAALSLEMKFLAKRFRGQFLVVDDTIGIIGRNILNQLNLLLNGKQLEWREFES